MFTTQPLKCSHKGCRKLATVRLRLAGEDRFVGGNFIPKPEIDRCDAHAAQLEAHQVERNAPEHDYLRIVRK
jgi:hypothetical protein